MYGADKFLSDEKFSTLTTDMKKSEHSNNLERPELNTRMLTMLKFRFDTKEKLASRVFILIIEITFVIDPLLTKLILYMYQFIFITDKTHYICIT